MYVCVYIYIYIHIFVHDMSPHTNKAEAGTPAYNQFLVQCGDWWLVICLFHGSEDELTEQLPCVSTNSSTDSFGYLLKGVQREVVALDGGSII